jgi:multisubunit Na+/H+ antiporter MnhG subunit
LIIISPNISNVMVLLGLVIYVYALVGIYLFAGVMRRAELDSKNNFSSMGRAILVLIRYATGEDF